MRLKIGLILLLTGSFFLPFHRPLLTNITTQFFNFEVGCVFRSELTEGSECSKNASRFTIVACAVCTRTRCNYDASVPLLCVLIVPSLFLSLSMGPHWPFNSLLYNQYRDRLLFLPLTPKGYAPSSHISILTERKKIGHIPLFALCLNSRNELTCVLIAKILWERKRDRRRENKSKPTL